MCQRWAILYRTLVSCGFFVLHSSRLRGERQGWPATPALLSRRVSFACAAGGKGRPRPLHPRPGALPLGTPIRCVTCRASGAHAYGQTKAGEHKCMFRHNGGMCRQLDCATDINCRGSGGRLALPAGSARGGAHSHARGADELQRGARGAEPRIRFDGQGVYNLAMPLCGIR